MAQMVFPSPRFRSVTAATGLADAHDNHVYSSAVLAHGGSSTAKLFSVPQGQAMIELKSSSITFTTNVYQATYSKLTTNLDRPSQLGDTLGDAAFRGLGITLEQAAFTATTGAQRAAGATPFEVADILAKCFGELKVGNKTQIEGPLFSFPGLGFAAGSISTTGTGETVGVGNNGPMASGRRLRTPIMCGRTDSLVYELTVGAGDTLAFSTTTSLGQPTLVWCVILADLATDVR